MKTKFVFTGILGLALLAMAAPHVWTFKQGGKFEGDYFSCDSNAVVVRKTGTNYTLRIADLSANDLTYVAKIKADQRQTELETEVKQMTAAGMMEFSAKLIEHFPEKVWDNKKGWMDVTFNDLSTKYIEFSDMELGLYLTDKNGDYTSRCFIFKQLNRPDENTKPVPNPLAEWAIGLKRGDNIRLIGHSFRMTDSGRIYSGSNFDHAGFLVEKIEVIESAAEKQARDQAAENR